MIFPRQSVSGIQAPPQDRPRSLRYRWYCLGRDLVQAYARSMFKMDIYYHHPLPEGGKILSSNHPSTSDPLLMTTLCDEQVSILILDTLFKVPVVGASLTYTGHIRVSPGDGGAALEQSLRFLKEGRTIGIFPEGEISPGEGQYLRPHTGVGRLALASGAPVYPIGIHLDHEKIKYVESLVEGKKEMAAWYTQGAYTVTVGEPMVFHGDPQDREYVRAVTEQIMARTITLTEESARRAALAKMMAVRPTRLSLRPARLACWALPVFLQVFPAVTGWIVQQFSYMGKVI